MPIHRTTLVSSDLSLAVVFAGTVLYGFMIAYYVFSLILNEQEKLRIHMQLSSPAKKDMTKEEQDCALTKASGQWMSVLSAHGCPAAGYREELVPSGPAECSETRFRPRNLFQAVPPFRILCQRTSRQPPSTP